MTQRRDRPSLVYPQRFNVKAGLPHLEVRSIVFFASLLVVVGLAGWLYLHQASEVAASVQQIRRIQDENRVLQQQILALQADVAMLGSLKHIQELGTRQGYVAPQLSDSTSYLVLPYQPDDTVTAHEEGEKAEAQEPASPEAVEGAKGLGEKLLDQLMAWMRSSAR